MKRIQTITDHSRPLPPHQPIDRRPVNRPPIPRPDARREAPVRPQLPDATAYLQQGRRGYTVADPSTCAGRTPRAARPRRDGRSVSNRPASSNRRVRRGRERCIERRAGHAAGSRSTGRRAAERLQGRAPSCIVRCDSAGGAPGSAPGAVLARLDDPALPEKPLGHAADETEPRRRELDARPCATPSPAAFASSFAAFGRFDDGASPTEGCAAPSAATACCRPTLRGNRMTLSIDGCQAPSRAESPSPGRPARSGHETHSSAAEDARARYGKPAGMGSRT